MIKKTVIASLNLNPVSEKEEKKPEQKETVKENIKDKEDSNKELSINDLKKTE